MKVFKESYSHISTAEMKIIEENNIKNYLNKTGKVSSGNKGHAKLGPVADNFNRVHDLKKRFKNNPEKAH